MHSKTARVNWKTKQFYCLRRIHSEYTDISLSEGNTKGRGSADHNTILRIQIEGFLLWTIMVYWKRRKWGKLVHLDGLPRWLSSKESDCQCRRCGFDPQVGKIPWRRKWLPNSSILAWTIQRTEESGGLYSPRDWKESDMTGQLTLSLLTLNQKNAN